MKNFLLLFLGLTLFLPLHAQTWQEMMDEPNANFFETQAAFNEAWAGKDYERGKGYKQFKRWESFMEKRVDENGYYDVGQSWKAFEAYQAEHSEKNLNSNWINLGPTSPPGPAGYNNDATGRIDCFGFHPTNPNTYWAGAPTGGLWKTTDDGANWTPVGDYWAKLGVSDIAIDGNNPNIIYVATGTRDSGGASYFGIRKSTNGGTTWTTLDGPSVTKIYRLLLDPNNSNHLLAATNFGLWRSLDAGVTWVRDLTLNTGTLYDMEFKPYDSNVVYVTLRGFNADEGQTQARFFKSIDNGATFNPVTMPYNATGVVRTALAVSAANPDKVYLSCSNTSSCFEGFYVSSDAGNTFSLVNNTLNVGCQAFYDWALAVSPLNDQEIYLGGVFMLKSVDGGVSWENPGGSIHVDIHAIEYHPVTRHTFVGSDGGIYRYTGQEGNWDRLNNGLAVTQSYRMSSSTRTNPSSFLIGNQDNGVMRHKDASGWRFFMAGDGMEQYIHPENPNIMYWSTQRGRLFGTTDGGETFTSLLNPSSTNFPNQTLPWITTFVVDPTDHETLYILFEDVWKSTDGGTNWANVTSGQIPSMSGTFRHIVISPSNPNMLYAADSNSRLFRTADGGTTWTSITPPEGEFIYTLTIHPNDPNKIWVGTYGNVFESADAGATWTDLTGSLPAIASQSIIYHEASTGSGGLYLSMELGVYYKSDDMADWVLINGNLPNVNVNEFDVNTCTCKLKVATYGRGTWETDLIGDCVPDCYVPAPIVVTNTNDAGVGSLRQAILDANSIALADLISFDIPEAGPHIIQPLTALPPITDADVVLDATTQPNYQLGTIQLDGSLLSAGTDYGLHLNGNSQQVIGFQIQNFPSRSIYLDRASGINADFPTVIKDNLIQNNAERNLYIYSTDYVELTGNTIQNNVGYGVYIVFSDNVKIGTIDSGNTITGHSYGVFLSFGTNVSITNNAISGSFQGIRTSGSNTIAATATKNKISNNSQGIYVSSELLMSQNSLYCNDNPVIIEADSPNDAVSIPVIQAANNIEITGTAAANSLVEVFLHDISTCTNDICQGEFFLGAVMADTNGDWVLESPFGGPFGTPWTQDDEIIATATQGHLSSAYSTCAAIDYITVLYEDCATAMDILDNQPLDLFISQGSGLNDFGTSANSDGCLNGENYGTWYYFEFTEDMPMNSSLEFVLNPNGGYDYDFAIWGPNAPCDNLLGPVRCSFSAVSITGLSNAAGDVSEGAAGDGFVKDLTVNPGEGYYLLINSPAANSPGGMITWSGNAAPYLVRQSLSVQMLDFAAMRKNDQILLKWKAQEAETNGFYEIERSQDAKNFVSIGQVAFNPDDHIQVANYQFIDSTASTHTAYYYRLKIITQNEQHPYSQIAFVPFNSDFSNVTIYPNPTKAEVRLTFAQLPKKDVFIKIFTVLGQPVYQAQMKASSMDIDMRTWTKGVYYVMVSWEGGQAVLPLVKE